MQLPSSGVTNGKVATSNGSGGFTWETPASGVTTYAALTDTDVAGAATGSYPKYNGTTSKWEVDNDLKNKVQNLDSNGKIDYSKVTGTPTIGTGSLVIDQNGVIAATFGANTNSNVQCSIITDKWHTIAATVSNGQVSFSGIDDTANNGYEVFVEITSSSTNKKPYATLNTISGEGTYNMTLVYDTDADNGATARLRIIK